MRGASFALTVYGCSFQASQSWAANIANRSASESVYGFVASSSASVSVSCSRRRPHASVSSTEQTINGSRSRVAKRMSITARRSSDRRAT
jgi:hypothetical protein